MASHSNLWVHRFKLTNGGLNNLKIKKTMNKILDFGYNVIAILLIAAVLFSFFGPAFALAVAAALFLYTLWPGEGAPRQAARAEVVRKLFSSDLQKMLWPDNTFYSGAQVDEAGWESDEVEIPQDEDGEAEVRVNPTQLPLPMSIEEDKKLSYKADLLVTLPHAVTWNNQLLVSYDKRAAKLEKHRSSLEKQIAERIMYGWSPTKAEFIRQTTGATTRPASAPGATGVRKVALEADFRWMAERFDRMDIPDDGKRRLVVDPGMKQDVWDVMKAFGSGTELNNFLRGFGKLGYLFSFEVFLRSTTQRYTEAATPVKKAVGSASATTDNVASIAFHLRHVRYCKSPVQVWMDSQPRGELAGGISMNCGVRSGGTMSRLSEKGVLALVEDNG